MKWIWTFGIGTPYKGKYVVIETDNDDGREYMFKKYGRDNCCMSYPYEKGIELVKKYNYKCIDAVVLLTTESDEYKNAMSKLYDSIITSSYILDEYCVKRIQSSDYVGKQYKAVKHDESYELMGDDNEDNGKG